jgi:organic radical activating enzyme
MTQTAILYIAERCNQSCVFCLEEDGGWREFVDPQTEQVFAIVENLYSRGARHITFMGGETFFRKDLGRIFARAKMTGFTRIGVTTNGTVLSKPGFVSELVRAGLDFIELSVHGHTAELANAIGGAHFTFERQRAALTEIEAVRLPVIVNVVVCRENKDHLLEVARYVKVEYPGIPVRFKLKFVSLQGLAAQRTADGESTALAYQEVDFVSLGDELEMLGHPFWFYNVPLCRLGRHARRSHEVSTFAADEGYFDFDHHGPPAYYDSGFQLEGRIWPSASCDACSVRPVCPGIEETYRRAHAPVADDSSVLGLAPRDDDPAVLLAFALFDRGLDPAHAPARLSVLEREPRPSRFIPSRCDATLRFRHPDEPEPVDVDVEARSAEARYLAATKRFVISYRPWAGEDPYGRPRVATLLAEAVSALARADERGAGLDEARAAVAQAASRGWVAEVESADAPLPKRRKGALPLLADRPQGPDRG